MNHAMRIAGLGLLGLLASPDAYASKFVFPYHHPDLEWYTIETDHFFVHYPVSKKTKEEGNEHYVNAEFMAKRTAKVSEEMWEPMCAEFDYYLTEKVHIVLLDQSDDLEGFTIPAWNWIEISGNPGGYFYRMRGRMEWFSDVLVHEFAHVVSLKRNAAIAEGVGAILIGGLVNDGYNDQSSGGEIALQGASEPFWWSEGGAEYWSDQTGYNWWTSSRDANIRTTVLEDRLLTYDEWVARMDKRDWGDGERGYQQGYSFGLYLRERFGDDIYARMSQESGKRWRAQWETIIEELTGVKAEQLYWDWRGYLEQKYGATHQAVKAEGEVVGGELELTTGSWVVRDPDARDKWLKAVDDEGKGPKSERKRRARREGDKHMTGTWDFYPKMSDDGRWMGEHSSTNGGITFLQYPEELLPAIAGQDPDPSATAEAQRIAGDTMLVVPNFAGSAFGHSFDFVPGQDKAVVSGNEDSLPRKTPYIFRVERDGYNWGELWLVDLTPSHVEKRKHRGEKVEVMTNGTKHFLGTQVWQPGKLTAIPNTERAADPAVSPDGKKVAYFEYGDGTLNLVVINLDGTEKKYLTSFDDGTWLQNADWSPDGKQIVFSMLRNFRQDLYVVNVDGSGGLVALNRDEAEDQDAFWGKDGNIYFSSDPTGIFNIYRYEPATGKVVQLTNVIGGAECPWITPQGNLLYTDMTAHGWKNKVVARTDFLEKDATDLFDFTPDHEEVKADLAYTEDLSGWAAKAEKYPALGSWMPPTAYPILRFENDSRTNFGLQLGGQLYAQDFVEDHTVVVTAMAGEDPLVAGGYTYNGWYPAFSVFAYHYEAKFDYAFLLDDDNDTTTTDDQTVFEGKQNQFVNGASFEIAYPLNAAVNATLFARGFEFGFRGTSDTEFQPYLVGAAGGLRLMYSNAGTYVGNANLRAARVIDLTYSHGYSDLVYAPYGGHDSDDGMLLDDYRYNRFEARWTEHLPLPTFGIPLLKEARDHRHSLQLDGQVGLLDRNVSIQDEFRGGGTHPYFVGSGSLQPNNQFSGYPGFSLSGETMLVGSAAYRFPVARRINQRWGPFYLYDVYAQVGGTAGNFWSYRPPDETDSSKYYYDQFGQRVARDEGDVRREIPFIDQAYKNGGNPMLYDANAEIRVSSTLFGENPWASFFRVAYGFNEVKGVGDVNGDDVQDTTETGLGDALSNESEMPGFRFYVGLGTGW